MKRIVIYLLLLFILSSCDKNNFSDYSKLENYLKEIMAQNNLSDYGFVIIIPMNRCSNCVDLTLEYMISKAARYENILFVVNNIRSLKEFNLLYDVDYELKNVIVDNSDYFEKFNFEFNNAGYYIINGEEITKKIIFEPNKIYKQLNNLDPLLIKTKL